MIRLVDVREQINADPNIWRIYLMDLKAISIVESPLRFRIRKIFVLENFLSRA